MDRLQEEVVRRWRDYICNPTGAGRFLSPLGSGVAGDVASAIGDDDLQAFIIALAGQKRRDDPVILAEALDLSRDSYKSFFDELLPGILNSLANERVAEERVVGPALQGRPDWGRTVLGRRTGLLGPIDFLARIPVRSFALPENQLIRWLITSINEGASRINKRAGGRLPPAIRALQVKSDQVLLHPWFSQVDPPAQLEPHMITCAQRQRIPGYREAAALAEARFRLTLETPDARRLAVLDLLKANWLSPIHPDDLFELYVLVLVIDALAAVLGPPVEYGLVAAGRDHVARFSDGNHSIRVLFDQAPPGGGWSRVYDEIRSNHFGLAVSPRRPDIIVLRDDRPKRALMVEVKRTSDPDYLSDSIYKGLGYLQDFAGLWRDRPGKPQLLIVIPGDNVRPHDNARLDSAAMVICGDGHTELMKQLIQAGVGL